MPAELLVVAGNSQHRLYTTTSRLTVPAGHAAKRRGTLPLLSLRPRLFPPLPVVKGVHLLPCSFGGSLRDVIVLNASVLVAAAVAHEPPVANRCVSADAPRRPSGNAQNIASSLSSNSDIGALLPYRADTLRKHAQSAEMLTLCCNTCSPNTDFTACHEPLYTYATSLQDQCSVADKTSLDGSTSTIGAWWTHLAIASVPDAGT